MRATCLRVMAVSQPGPPSDPRPRISTYLELRLLDTKDVVVIELSRAFRRHFLVIQPHRRLVFQTTMPPEVTVEPRVRKGRVTYHLDTHDLEHWADEVRSLEGQRSYVPGQAGTTPLPEKGRVI